MNFLQNRLMSKFDKCKLIPINVMPTKFYTITFEGWKPHMICYDDAGLNESIIMACASMDKIIELYRETHAFTEPMLSIMPNGIITLKIGTMELERYNEIIEGNQH